MFECLTEQVRAAPRQSRPGTGLMRLSLARFGMIGGDKMSVVVRGFL